MLNLSKMTSPIKLFPFDCIKPFETLFSYMSIPLPNHPANVFLHNLFTGLTTKRFDTGPCDAY